MNPETNIYVGQIKRTHGVRGDVQLVPRSGIELKEAHVKFLMVSEKNGEPIPWFPESITKHTAGYLVKFETINSEKEARRFAGARVFCSPDAVIEHEDISLEGFAVEDETHGQIGNVAAVIEYPGQMILSVINKQGKEILLPLNTEFVREIDEEEKTIYYDAPEGLIDVYLNPGTEDENEKDGDEEDNEDEKTD